MASGIERDKDPEESSGKTKRALFFLLFLFLGIGFFLLLFSQNELAMTNAAVLWALGLGGLLIIEQFLGHTFSSYRILRLVLIILFSSLFAYYLFGMNLEAKFWLIDDHQIMMYLGEDGNMALSEIPGLLIEKTEVGKFGDFPRFRPSYYTVRLLETWLWGGNPSLWYLSHFAMVILTVAVGWYVLAVLIGFLPAALVMAFIFLWPAWGDIFARLGPAEAYAAVGLAFFFLGSYLILHKPWSNSQNAHAYLGWLLVATGIIVAVGSKENFLLLLPIVFMLLMVALKRRRTPRFALLCTLLIVTFSGVVAYAVLSSLSSRGSDVYSRPTGFSYRLSLVWDLVFTVHGILFLVVIAFLIVMLLYSYRAAGRSALRRPTWLALIIVIMSYLLLYVGQFIFYAGDWPTGGRYDFPGLLYRPVVFITLIWYVFVVLQQLGVDSSVEKGLRAGLLIGAALFIAAFAYAEARAMGFLNVEQTQNFTRQLETVASNLGDDPDSALVIESHFVRDYEAIVSWGRFLHAQGIDNPIFLRIYGYSSDSAEIPRDVNLALQLERASQKGELGLNPIQELADFEDKCYSLQLSGHTDTGCRDAK